jgi:hypothetical protein
MLFFLERAAPIQSVRFRRSDTVPNVREQRHRTKELNLAVKALHLDFGDSL